MLQFFRKLFQSGVSALLLFVYATGAGQAEAFIDGAAMHRIGEAENLCSLTFDDGPSKHTERLLDILAAHKVKATFFVIGDRASRNPNTIRRMIAEGHEIANHTLSHKSLRHMPEAEQLREIGKVQEILRNYGVSAILLRPPFGRYDPTTQRILDKLHMRVALWSADSHDWQRRASIENIKSVYGTAARTGVILFHDTHQPTVDAMNDILSALKAGQCRFVTMSEFYAVADARLNDTPLPAGFDSAPASTESPQSISEPDDLQPATGAGAPLTDAPSDDWSVDGVIGAVRDWANGLMGETPPPAPQSTNVANVTTSANTSNVPN